MKKPSAQAEKAVRLKSLLAEQDFRIEVWDLLEQCGVFRSSFSTNALTMALLEGKRDIGLRLISDLIDADQEGFLRMQTEAQAKKSSGQKKEEEVDE